MDNNTNMDVRRIVDRELGVNRSTAPGMLAVYGNSGEPVALKEVIAIIRPGRWRATKEHAQRLRIPAFTQHRILGRGAEGGLWQHQGDSAASVPYLPKRMISWIVEAPLVAPLVDAIIRENQTGQPGDGKIFVLAVDDAIRVRTSERGMDAIKPEFPHESVAGTTVTA